MSLQVILNEIYSIKSAPHCHKCFVYLKKEICVNLNTMIIRRMSRLEMFFFSFSSAQCTFNINVCYFCKKSLFKSNKDDSRTEREIAVHDNASVADKLLSCLDSNYCLTLLNPWGPSTSHVYSEGREGVSNKSNSIFYP